MSTLAISIAVLLTIILTLAFGIFAGYVAVMGVLRAFGHRRQIAPAAPATLAHSPSGD